MRRLLELLIRLQKCREYRLSLDEKLTKAVGVISRENMGMLELKVFYQNGDLHGYSGIKKHC